MQTSLIGQKAYCNARFIGRAQHKQGHDVRLIAAQFMILFHEDHKAQYLKPHQEIAISDWLPRVAWMPKKIA